MSVTTSVLVPAEQIGALRESLLATHRELVDEITRLDARSSGEAAASSPPVQARARLDAVEEVLAQVGWTVEQASVPRQVTGQRTVLWGAAYDIVCVAAERLAEICTAYWLGATAPSEIYAGLAELGARFELLESLGPPSR